MSRVLAVHPDADMLDLMAAALKDKFPDVITDRVRNASDAADLCRAQSRDPFKAVVVNYSIAADLRTPRSEAELKGMEFLESLKDLGHGQVPKSLIAPSATSSLLSRVYALPRCFLLLIDQSANFEDSFISMVGRELTRSSDAPPQEGDAKQVKVIVNLNLEKQLWEYELKGVGFTYIQPQPAALHIDAPTFKRLVNRSRRVGDANGDWEQVLLEIGQDLGQLLLYGNPDFLKALDEAQNIAGGTDRKSICFTVEKSVHHAALEALTGPNEDSFWMLRVPMYRRLVRSGQVAMQRSVLFKQGAGLEPFNALVIESPAEGVVRKLTDKDGRPLRLNPLVNVTREADAVMEALNGKARLLKRVGPNDVPAGGSFRQYLQDVMKENCWDLVHYAGHSHYDEATGKGYLLFPGDFVEELDIEIFNTYLDRAQTRFLYLSGCKSSEAGFVFELARLQIPGILGFRWPINDLTALEFAQHFYRHLFSGKSAPNLERAFLSTRCAIRDAHKEDMIWAAAMLILQDAD